ncbi:hypothetical protein J8TS2_07240 [Lederbergia ruris]|uniref:Pyrrolo-quinoline quinone repeat domain-containing protein n=2 Tax=Lederbergia ruris TaxID=217495 RepID=A0ABQ4KEK2_9BACI|nr:hypothetical protein J8TS2_07240 [Lederbergia ruris]
MTPGEEILELAKPIFKEWTRKVFFMKRITLLLSMITIFLVMTGCASSSSPKGNDKEPDTEIEKSQDQSNEDTDEKEEDLSSSLGSIEDFTFTSIDDYDQDQWIRMETEKPIENGAFVDGDQFFINTEDDETIAYTKDMKEIWKSEVPYPFRRPNLMTDDYILVNNEVDEGEGTFVEALDKKTGESVYKINLVDYSDLGEVYVMDDAIYFAAGKKTNEDELFADDFTLFKYQLNDGSKVWEKKIGNLKQSGKGSPFQLAFKDDHLYYVSADSQLKVVEMETGDEVWKQELPESLRYSIPFFADDSLYILDAESVFHEYDMETGEPLDDYQFQGSVLGPVAPYPLFDGTTMIYEDVDFDTGDTTLIAVDMDAKEEIWSLDFGQHFIFGAYIIDNTLYILTQEGVDDTTTPSKLLKLDPQSGELVEGIELNDRMAEASNSMSSTMGNDRNGDYITVFHGKVAYFLK